MPIQQIVLHPTVDRSLKYASTTVGRDKVYRAVQYFARFLAWYLKRQDYNNKEIIQRLSNLKSALGLSRKLMRLGKSMEHLQHATKALNVEDEFAKYVTIGRQLGYAVYLFWDTFSWVHSAGVYKFQQIKRINENSCKAWLMGLLFSIIHGLYKLHQINSQRGSLISKAKIAETSERSKDTATLKKERKAAIRQLIQDVLDCSIPATALGYIHLEDGLVGLTGFITSIMGAQSQWKKVNGP
ncbi:unnamed protein product [Rhizophagus irregularis]|uniref:Peroxisomal biogenesis factor 11 n=1 Tax=Rhizophagus irregularis TaxID=588596 RepID=A0A2N1MIU6_9GLOM|nr:peroxisomal biogenesis factor 11 [Rhizophagus irregularis]CAB4391174.1 unnamed protein product [Rhizophagus irregularis]CAB5362841.1 unnamed protein product [Rhizophagus irregularis]